MSGERDCRRGGAEGDVLVPGLGRGVRLVLRIEDPSAVKLEAQTGTGQPLGPVSEERPVVKGVKGTCVLDPGPEEQDFVSPTETERGFSPSSICSPEYDPGTEGRSGRRRRDRHRVHGQ